MIDQVGWNSVDQIDWSSIFWSGPVVHDAFPPQSFSFLSTDRVYNRTKSERRAREDQQHYRWVVRFLTRPFSPKFKIGFGEGRRA